MKVASHIPQKLPNFIIPNIESNIYLKLISCKAKAREMADSDSEEEEEDEDYGDKEGKAHFSLSGHISDSTCMKVI